MCFIYVSLRVISKVPPFNVPHHSFPIEIRKKFPKKNNILNKSFYSTIIIILCQYSNNSNENFIIFIVKINLLDFHYAL